MVGGEFAGFTIYEPYAFDRSYFVPDGWISVDAKTCTSSADKDTGSTKEKTSASITTSVPNNESTTKESISERGTTTSDTYTRVIDDIISLCPPWLLLRPIIVFSCVSMILPI